MMSSFHPSSPCGCVTRVEWLKERRALLAKEKAATRLLDELAAARRALPCVKLEKDYLFDGPLGKESLASLFDGRSQLVVYHFMLGADWEAGCPSCSYVMDHVEPAIPHLAERDVSLAAISSAPFDKIEAFKRRMGWRFKWLSAHACDFNQDFAVTFTPEQLAGGEHSYNHGTMPPYELENPGLSVFRLDERGNVYHIYSTYARGLDALLGAYTILDMTPKGRDEQELPYPMAWVKHRDKYGMAPAKPVSCCHGQGESA